MRVEPLGATLGAVVTGVRLASLDGPTWLAVEEAFHEHAVLVFPDQRLTRDEQRAFGLRFGELDSLNESDGYVPIANTHKDGTVRSGDDPLMTILRGNEGWHTDSSYMPVSAKASMLSAHVVPAASGTTSWADMRAAYDALEPARRERIEGLCAHHSIVWSQRRAGLDLVEGAYGYDVEVEPLRPLVKVHPVTGRPALFIGRHAHAIPGMSEEESVALLDELLAFACQPPRVYTHRWKVGDLVVWDNRCVLHRADPWDWNEPRVMVHTRIAGDPATEAAVTGS